MKPKEQLELREIAPYLPYKLKIEYGDSELELTHQDTITNDFEDMICIPRVLDNQFRPILRSLSQLTDKFKSKYHFYYDNEGGFQLKAKNELYTRLDDLEYLFKNHFDVFGLLEKNLATEKDKKGK